MHVFHLNFRPFETR